MAKFKKYGIPVLAVILGLILNLILSIFLHGFVMAVVEDPFTIPGLTQVFEDQASSQILDTYQEGDSALTLLRKEDGNVFLLEFHKNLILNRYQLMDVVHIVPEAQEEHLPIKTVLRSYSVLIQNHETLTQESSQTHHLNFSNFFLLYGMNALLLLIMELVVYRTGKKYKKNRKKA